MPKDLSSVTLGQLDAAISSKSTDGPTTFEVEVETLISCANALANRSSGLGLDLASELLAMSKSAGKIRLALGTIRGLLPAEPDGAALVGTVKGSSVLK